MESVKSGVSPYRWVILAIFALVTVLIQIQWLTFAPIAREAKDFYAVSALHIDALSMVFMGVFIVMCIPASYVIDTYGIRIGIGAGAIMTGIFSMMKGFCAESYHLVFSAQIGLAVAQPFILNGATKVAGRWFPLNERATAVGVATLAQFIGIIIVMIATPALISAGNGGTENIKKIMMIYGYAALAGAIIFLLFFRESPASASANETDNGRFRFFEGFKHILSNRDMRMAMVLFFIGLGIFNAISTVIDQISESKGFSMEQSGLIGGTMLIAGIIGALIFPPLSDKLRKRKSFLILGMALMAPGLAGMAFSENYILVIISSFVIGFFLLGSAGPVGFQYAAEVSYPAPESTSQGVLLLSGQVSGIIFIVGMNKLGIMNFLVFFVILAIINVFLCSRLEESKMIMADRKKTGS